MMKKITVLGSTGSVGSQSLCVARENNYKITALAANNNIKLLESQAREFLPDVVAVANEKAASELKLRLKDTDIKVFSGEDGVNEVAAYEKSDTVISAIVGIAGLKPTLSAIRAKKTVALSNKETLVTAGDIVKREAKENKVDIIPVDSEHSAIFQSFRCADGNLPNKILLTASGGPFYGMTAKELSQVTVEDTLKHPNWSMGKKITVDCATLMNKGLEVIEAVHLFGVLPSKIEVLIHRQSILHSAIEFSDGAVIGQMGTPDMKLPIQYALTFPERKAAFSKLDLTKIGTLTFSKPDTETFDCLPLCVEAIEKGGLYPTAVNGANEESVKLFLNGKIGFLDIARLNRAAYENAVNKNNFTVEDVFDTDKAAREFIKSHT